MEITIYKKNIRAYSDVYTCIWLFPSFYFIMNHVEERFFYIMLPFFSIIAAFGIYQICIWFREKRWIIPLIFGLFILNVIFHYLDYSQFLNENQKFYLAGKKLESTMLSRSKVCLKNFSVAFFGQLGFVKMPICTVPELYQYLQNQNTEYLILGDEVNSLRSEFLSIYNEKESEYFELLETIKTNHAQFKLFRTQKL